MEKASCAGLIDLPTMIERLRKTNFWVHPKLLKDVLDRNEKRKSGAKDS